MSRQPPRRSVLRMLLSALTEKAPEQAKQQLQLPQRPTPDNRDAWLAYWKEQNQPWRTESEIDTKRQQELSKCRIIIADIEKGIYLFRGMKLSRADVEWLLATHENGRGPVDWSDIQQRERKGLDLRGAILCGVNLSCLPLACSMAGLTQKQWTGATQEQREASAVHLEGANLFKTHLEGASLRGAHLEGANIKQALLEQAHLTKAFLAGASLQFARLMGTGLMLARLEGKTIPPAELQFVREWLRDFPPTLPPADLRYAFFSQTSVLDGVILYDTKHGGVWLVDVKWGEANIAVMDWASVKMLGDEQEAQQPRNTNREKKPKLQRLKEYTRALRANRQLSLVLQSQALNEDAARFAYRAQVLQKTVFRRQMLLSGVKLRQRVQALGAWLFSWFLFLLAGYGYKPGRSFFAYLLVIGTFMALYLLLDPHLLWYEAVVVSMTAFHGRGFSPSTFSPGDPLSIVSAVEAFVGLIIEVTFIAALTRRFFGQ